MLKFDKRIAHKRVNEARRHFWCTFRVVLGVREARLVNICELLAIKIVLKVSFVALLSIKNVIIITNVQSDTSIVSVFSLTCVPTLAAAANTLASDRETCMSSTI